MIEYHSRIVNPITMHQRDIALSILLALTIVLIMVLFIGIIHLYRRHKNVSRVLEDASSVQYLELEKLRDEMRQYSKINAQALIDQRKNMEANQQRRDDEQSAVNNLLTEKCQYLHQENRTLRAKQSTPESVISVQSTNAELRGSATSEQTKLRKSCDGVIQNLQPNKTKLSGVIGVESENSTRNSRYAQRLRDTISGFRGKLPQIPWSSGGSSNSAVLTVTQLSNPVSQDSHVCDSGGDVVCPVSSHLSVESGNDLDSSSNAELMVHQDINLDSGTLLVTDDNAVDHSSAQRLGSTNPYGNKLCTCLSSRHTRYEVAEREDNDSIDSIEMELHSLDVQDSDDELLDDSSSIESVEDVDHFESSLDSVDLAHDLAHITQDQSGSVGSWLRNAKLDRALGLSINTTTNEGVVLSSA